MTVAVTGTPGVGKTSLCKALEAADWQVHDIKALADGAGAVVGQDLDDDAWVIDVKALRKHVPQGPRVALDGHLAHLLPVDEIWVLRLDPHVLRTRLEARGYTAAKVQENLEAEAMDLILQEALDQGPPVRQRDGTRRNVDELLSAFVENQSGAFKTHDLEAVDWSDRLPV